MIVFYSLDTLEIWIILYLWEKSLCPYHKDTPRLSIVCNICASGASIIKYVYCIPLRLLKWQITCNQFANGNRMYNLGPYLFWLVKCHKFFTTTTVTSSALFKNIKLFYKMQYTFKVWSKSNITKYIDLASNLVYNNVKSNHHIQYLHSDHHLVSNLFIFEKCDCRPFPIIKTLRTCGP